LFILEGPRPFFSKSLASAELYSKLSTCFVFASPLATRLYASTAFSNGTISIGGGFKTPASKPLAISAAIFPYLSRRQSITIHPKQTREIVIEIDEIETDARLSLLAIATCRPLKPSDRNAGSQL
jgi:hypothetical protein